MSSIVGQTGHDPCSPGMYIRVPWAGEGMEGDGTASRSRWLKKSWYIPGDKEEISKRVGGIIIRAVTSLPLEVATPTSALQCEGWVSPRGPAPVFLSLPSARLHVD